MGNVTLAAEPTIFLVEQHGQLFQRVDVLVTCRESLVRGELLVSGPRYSDRVTLGQLPAGHHAIYARVPEVSENTPYRLKFSWEGGACTTEVMVSPLRHWVIDVVQHSHLDVGYTDPQADVIQYHLRYLDQVVEWCEGTRHTRTPFKWTVETTLPLTCWNESRPPWLVNEMRRLALAGQIEVCGAWVNMHTEAYHLDELARTFEFAGRLRRDWGIAITTVMQTDVPGMTEGFLKCVQNFGARYVAAARNYAGRSLPERTGARGDARLFYWIPATPTQAPPVLVWYTDTPHGLYMEGNAIGLTDSLAVVESRLPALLRKLEEEHFPLDHVLLRVQGTRWDNAGPNIMPTRIVDEWNQKWAFPKLRLATPREFFAAVETQASSLPTFSGDWTDWWADGIGSASRENAMNRMAHHIMRTAEYFHALAHLNNASQYPTSALTHVLRAMALFDEHTWGASYPWEDTLHGNTSGVLQWMTKAGMAHRAYYGSVALRESGMAKLAGALRGERSEHLLEAGSIICFNPAPEMRSGVVTAWIPDGPRTEKTIEVVDRDSGKVVPHAVIDPPSTGIEVHIDSQGTWSEGEAGAAAEGPRPRGREVMIFAKDVPALGFKSYLVRQAHSTETVDTMPSETRNLPILETQFYRVTFDDHSGAILSLYDKELAVELVDREAPFAWGQYIYDRYTTAPRFNHLSSRIRGAEIPFLGNRSGVRMARLMRADHNALYDALYWEIVAAGCESVSLEVRVYNDVKRLEFVYGFRKPRTEVKEAAYIAFPFDKRFGEPSFEVCGSISSRTAPHVPGWCDYLQTVGDWIALSDNKVTVLFVPVDAPLMEIGAIHTPYNPFKPTTPEHSPSLVYSYAFNNIWDTNFPNAQGGEMILRYVLSSYAGPFSALLIPA
ncbi:MAG: hypothetical protein OWU33_01165 [Firmicutes bacterium]|nr:hypothetical protein [Bacillota bacterium]